VEKINPYLDLYDQVFFYLWDVNIGIHTSKRQVYAGISRYGDFLLSEIDRYKKAEKCEHAIERTGKVAPKTILTAWTYNVLEDCHDWRLPPPMSLCYAIYWLMGASHLSLKRGRSKERHEHDTLLEENPRLGVREAAKVLNVSPSTVTRWRKRVRPLVKGSEEETSAEYTKIREITNVDEYYPMRHRLLRIK